MNDRFVFLASLLGWAFVAGLLAGESRAGQFAGVSKKVEVHALLHTVSVHTDHNDTLNNDNLGAGLLVRKSDWLVAGGWLRNSQDRPSWYGMVGWQPEVLKDFRLGIGAGFATNYRTSTTTCTTQRVRCRNVTTCEEQHKDHVRPAVALIATYQIERVGINLMLAPPASSQSSGVAHLFFSVRL